MMTLVSLSKRPIFILSFLLLTLILFLPTETLGLDPPPNVWSWNNGGTELSVGDGIEVNFTAWNYSQHAGEYIQGSAPAAGLQVQLLTDLSAEPIATTLANGEDGTYNFTLDADLGMVRLYARAVDPNNSNQPTTEIGSLDPAPRIVLSQNDGNETLDPGDSVELIYPVAPPDGSHINLQVYASLDNEGNRTATHFDSPPQGDGSQKNFNFTLLEKHFSFGDQDYLYLELEVGGSRSPVKFGELFGNWQTKWGFGDRGRFNQAGEVVSIPDANLRAVLERTLGKSSDDEIRDIELETIVHLHANSWDTEAEITSLEGIKYCVNLWDLQIQGQSSISAEELKRLAALPKLGALNMNEATPLTDLSVLKDLPLGHLHMSNGNGQGKLNDISDLSGMTSLWEFRMSGNEVTDISAAKDLPHLHVFEIGANPIQKEHAMEVLSSMTELRHLGTSYQDWTNDDLSQLLANLTKLEEFHHHHNASFEGKITDISAFAHLPNLRHLKLEGQSISQIPDLSTWKSLQTLAIYNNPLEEGSSEVIRDLLMAGVKVYFNDTILIGDWKVTHSGNIEQGPGSYYTGDSSITQTFDHFHSQAEAWVKVFQLAQEDPYNPPVLWQLIHGRLWVHRQKFLSQNLDSDSGKSLSDPSSFNLLTSDTWGAGPVYSLHFIDPRLNWSIPFRVQSMQVGVDVVNLVAGVAEEASDGYDKDWDVLSPPAPIAPVALHANWLHREGDSVLGLSRNYRSGTDLGDAGYQVVFLLEILADETPFILLWDLSEVPKSFTSISLRQVKPSGINMSLNLRHQGQAVTLPPSDGSPYLFELEISSKYQLPVSMGWNMISVPGDMQDPSPQGLVGENAAAMLPMFAWNPEGFSYRKVEELRMGQAYWLLVWDESPQASGEVLEFGLNASDSYSVDLKEGWNMLGSVAGVYDFSDPQDVPDGSIADYSLFEWKAEGNSYRPSTKLEEGKGYWVLCWNDCQLSVGGSNSPSASPQRLAKPEGLITLQLTGGLEQQRLEIGWATNPTGMDHPLPPYSPQAGDLEAYLVGDKYRWSRQIQKVSDSNKEWHLRLKSKQPTILKVESTQEMGDQELVIREGDDELVVAVGKEIQLPSGEREYILTLQPIKPKVTQLLQNYPNPFNPETWIPFELNQDSDVSLTIYDTTGRQIRHIDLGFQPAGVYLQRDRAIYWDGRTQSGEQVASGTYFYTLKTAGYVSTQKMIILK